MKYMTRADLLVAAGENIKMQEAAGIEPMCKQGFWFRPIQYTNFIGLPESYEFPLAVIEGRPAFVGDVLYTGRGERFTLDEKYRQLSLEDGVSWNPPKPKTMMVELLIEDVQFLRHAWVQLPSKRISEACRKALEE